MKPFLTKGYTKRKLHTGNQSVQFDEEREVNRPLFYSTIRGSFSSDPITINRIFFRATVLFFSGNTIYIFLEVWWPTIDQFISIIYC